MNLSHCFLKGSIVKNLLSTEKYQAIHELIQRAPVFSEIRDLNRFEEAVFEREKVISTGIGRNVAVAHAKVPDTDKVLVALGISVKGIDYDALDGKPVHFLFLIANNPKRQEEYLKLLASIMRFIRNDSFRKFLLEKAASKLSPDEIGMSVRDAFLHALNNFSSQGKPKSKGQISESINRGVEKKAAAGGL